MQLTHASYTSAAAITKSDTTKVRFRAIMVTATAGLVRVEPANNPGSTVDVYGALGTVIPIAVTMVYSTGTAATAMVGFN